MNPKLAEIYRESQHELIAILRDLWRDRSPQDDKGPVASAYTLYADAEMTRRIRDALGIWA